MSSLQVFTMTDPEIDALLSLGDKAVTAVAQRSTTAFAECVVRTRTTLSARVRAGQAELVERVVARSLALRVISGQRTASVSSNDCSIPGIDEIVSQALEIAEMTEPDPFISWPGRALLWNPEYSNNYDLYDPNIMSTAVNEMIAKATQTEAAALAFDARISPGEGAVLKTEHQSVAYVFSNRLRAAFRTSSLSLRVAITANDSKGTKSRSSSWTAARHVADLEDEVSVGQDAAQRALAKLGARSVSPCEVPVIFDPQAASALLKTFAHCVMGSSIWRGSSYLVGKEGSYVASELVNVVDDATIPRAPGTRPFDGEGLHSRKTVVIEKGILKTYLCDTYAAAKLNRQSTANAVRGPSGGVASATSNFILQAGADAPQEIIKGTKYGLYVTEISGYGFNPVTGNFSRAASGYWVENGDFAFPVTEVTISLNIDELWKRVDAVGSDLHLRSATESPTIRVARMYVAGQSARS